MNNTKEKNTDRKTGFRLISEGGNMYEKPSIYQILDEISMVCINQFRAAYEMLTSDDFSQGTVENLLFVTLAHWERLSEDIGEYFDDSESTGTGSVESVEDQQSHVSGQ